MTELKQLLELRNKIKEKKPDFIRQDNPKRMKVNYKWRKPKGIHSKIRHKFKGRRKMPSPGYKSPRKVKGMHSSGLRIVNISSIEKLSGIKNELEGIIVSQSVGMKKRLAIFKKAKELDIKVLNINVDQHIKKIENTKIQSSKKTAFLSEDKKKATIEEKKTEESIEKVPEKLSEEDKKEAEKKEKDKILTKKT